MAARMRISGDWSEVETTTTERASPSSPSEPSTKLPHLAPTLAYQANHRNIRFGVARHDADQRALAHSRTSKDADTLPSSHREQSVQSSDSRAERRLNRNSIEGRMQQVLPAATSPSSRECVLHPSGHADAVENPARSRRSPPGSRGARRGRSHGISEPNSLGRFQGHRDDVRSAKSDDLGEMRSPEPIFNFAAFSHRGQRARSTRSSGRWIRPPVRANARVCRDCTR